MPKYEKKTIKPNKKPTLDYMFLKSSKMNSNEI